MVKLRAIYRLWWEYLKLSDDYKRECERRIACQSCDRPIERKFSKKVKSLFGSLCTLSCFSCSNIGTTISYEISMRFQWFGDVHKDTFDNWWLHNENLIRIGEIDSIQIGGLEEYIDFCIRSFKSKEGREPTLKEFKDCFLKKIANTQGSPIYLKVNVVNITIDELKKRFVKLVKERKEEPCVKKYEMEYRRYIRLPISNTTKKAFYFRIEELKRYLQVYDLHIKKKLKMPDVIKMLKPKKDNKNINIQRAFYQDLQRAKILIKNAESGDFPGSYQPRRLPKTKK